LFDLEKAFDSTPHNDILEKSDKLKCPSLIGKWLLFYLKNRRFTVQVNNDKSHPKNVFAGIPQGGCISAFLFSIFINDVNKELKKTKNKFAVFADDISLWAHSKNIQVIQNKVPRIIYKPPPPQNQHQKHTLSREYEIHS